VPPAPKSPRKRSSFAAFTSSTEGLIVVEATLRRALRGIRRAAESGDADALARFLDLTRVYLPIVDRCREQLTADLKARTMYEDLRGRLESGMSNDEVQATLEYHFENMGWGSLRDAREGLRQYLIDVQGLDPESADAIVREGMPKRTARSRTLPITYKMRKVYKGMEATLTSDAEGLWEALEASEGAAGPVVGAQATPTPDVNSEEA